MNEELLKEKLEKHRLFLNGEEDGEKADFEGMDLSGCTFENADLRQANFNGANLTRAVFTNCLLQEAEFYGAKLYRASLSGCMLEGADFKEASLQNAHMTGVVANGRAYFANVNLDHATITDSLFRLCHFGHATFDGALIENSSFPHSHFHDANFQRASCRRVSFGETTLTRTCFDHAYLIGCMMHAQTMEGATFVSTKMLECLFDHKYGVFDQINWHHTKEDILKIARNAVLEIPGLLLALEEGRVEGTSYNGPCACLVGTIANLREVNRNELAGIICDERRPAERFFLMINKGDTPRNNAFARLAYNWIEEFYLGLPAEVRAEAEKITGNPIRITQQEFLEKLSDRDAAALLHYIGGAMKSSTAFHEAFMDGIRNGVFYDR